MQLSDDNYETGARLSRRSFLAAANALVLISVLDACTGKHPHASTNTPATSSSGAAATGSATAQASAQATSDDVVALLRQAVQASPDFLQQAAAVAVASKDPGMIAAFVRDQISVVPSWSKGDDPVGARRWGSRATLRGGAGTLRDRADLLVELLTAAGLTATVMSADRPPSIDIATLYQLRAADFEPDQALIAKAVKLLPAGSVPAAATASSAPPVANAADTARVLAATIPVALQSAQIRPDLLPASVPVVAVGAAGAAQQYFFALGDLAAVSTAPAGLATARAAQATPQVSFRVYGLANPAPGATTPRGELVPLVTGTWTAEQVFGRQVMLNFVPVSGPSGYLGESPGDQPIRLPLLRVQDELGAYQPPSFTTINPSAPASSPAPVATTTSASELIATGSLITLQGDVLTTSDSSSAAPAQGAFGPLVSLSASQRAAAIAQASTIHASVSTTVFPEITLDVAVLDGSGQSVNGLDAGAFTVKEGGRAVPTLQVMANTTSSTLPRVLVAYDTTGSVAETWPSAAAKAAFEQSLATTLVTAAAATPFDVQIVGLDGAVNPRSDGWNAPDQSTALAFLENAGGQDSVVWGAASGAAIDQGASAIIMVSDFNSLGESVAQIATDQRRIAAGGVPVICLPIGKPDEAAIATMLALSGGTRLDPLAPTTAAALAALIQPLVSARTQCSYRMRYTAPSAGPAQRTVTVSLSGRNTPVATTMYTAPATPQTPWSFVGLYVTINIADREAQNRHLAGLTFDSGGEPLGPLDDAAATAETRAAIDGLTTIAIEPGAVTTGALVDDLLSCIQSAQPVVALPSTASDSQVASTATKNGVRRVPPILLTLLQAPSSLTDPHAVPTMRVAILQERAGGHGVVDSRLDLPPTLNTIEPLGTDPVAAFAAGLTTSCQLAADEAVGFDSSAYRDLIGAPLTFISASTSSDLDAFLNSLPADQQAAWTAVLQATYFVGNQHMVVPVGASTGAFWVVDVGSGAVSAVLLDGSGGAFSQSTCTNARSDPLTLVINALSYLLTAYAVGCMALAATGISSLYCVGEAADAIYKTVAIVLAVVGAAHGGSWAGLFIGVGSAFIPSTFTRGVAVGVGQVFGTVGATAATWTSCPGTPS